MSESVFEAARQLNASIKASDEYHKLKLYQKELVQIPELYEKVQEFRKRNYELQLGAKHIDDKETFYRMSEEYKSVLENPLVNSYLNAELAFCKMSQNAIRLACKDIDLQLDFM